MTKTFNSKLCQCFRLGQTVWFEPDDKRDKGYYTTITKVGRQYYTIERWNLKFDIERHHRCDFPQGVIYNSEQEAKDYQLAENMLFQLKNRLSIKPSLSQMKEVYKILGLEVDND